MTANRAVHEPQSGLGGIARHKQGRMLAGKHQIVCCISYFSKPPPRPEVCCNTRSSFSGIARHKSCCMLAGKHQIVCCIICFSKPPPCLNSVTSLNLVLVALPGTSNVVCLLAGANSCVASCPSASHTLNSNSKSVFLSAGPGQLRAGDAATIYSRGRAPGTQHLLDASNIRIHNFSYAS